ncbi:MAG: nitronate monooxygenase [Candidatus Lokiarchaeota archaeon]|nr:nitronate monooxygenase [Candidatus Lokiarchaeota archaeon]
MKWKTKITKIFGIQYPLVMGAFGGWGKAEFASTFSNAGGLGIIAALNFPKPEDFKKDVQMMKRLTTKPFGINLSLPHHILEENSEGKKTQERYLEYVDIALNENCNIFTTSGYKASFIGRRVHKAGCIWFHKCVLVKHAISAEKEGADGVTLVGLEGTGFKNPLTNTTLVNITLAKKMLKIPIIAAGGIGDARGFLGALAMGADAICLGTALMATKECPVSLRIKEKWLNLDIFEEIFHNKIYKYSIKNFMAPSTAIGHRKKLVPMHKLIEELITEANSILDSWGFSNNEFNTLDL